MKPLILSILLLLILPGCFHFKSIALFEYTVEFAPLQKQDTVQVRKADGTVVDMSPIEVIDLVSLILNSQGAIDAAKIVAIAVAGDPGAITAWQGQCYVVRERKSLLKFTWHDKGDKTNVKKIRQTDTR